MKHVEAAVRDFTGIFDRLALPYAIMGGLAVRAFGVPRPTYDVGITLLVEDAQRPALLDAIEEAGYSVPDVYRSGWVDRVGQMPLIKFRLYRDTPGESVDVDLFLAETAYQRQLMQRRVAADVEGIGRVWIVSAEDLILLKLVAGRPRDKADIDDVRFMGGALDEDYMRTWAARLNVGAELAVLLSQPPLGWT